MPRHPRPRAYTLATLLCAACSRPSPSASDTTESSHTAGADTPDTDAPDSSTPTTGDPPTGTTSLTTTEPTSTTDLAASTGAASSDSGESSGGPAPLCGNAVLDADEQCDLGVAHNWDFGACTSQCQSARCGDGLVFAGVETCDDAAANGTGYNQCDPVTCHFGERCGDGVLTPEFEECDGGGPDGSGEILDADTTCRPGCTWDGRLAFLSSIPFRGDLGGITGADLHCQNLASAANIAGHAGFRAWLSDADESPLGRLTFGPERIVLLSGIEIAENLDMLIAHGPGDGISLTEQRTSLISARVWTNTAVTGEIFSTVDHCQNWTSSAKQLQARVGVNAVPKLPADTWTEWSAEKHWTSRYPQLCNKEAHLYCIEDATP